MAGVWVCGHIRGHTRRAVACAVLSLLISVLLSVQLLSTPSSPALFSSRVKQPQEAVVSVASFSAEASPRRHLFGRTAPKAKRHHHKAVCCVNNAAGLDADGLTQGSSGLFIACSCCLSLARPRRRMTGGLNCVAAETATGQRLDSF